MFIPYILWKFLLPFFIRGLVFSPHKIFTAPHFNGFLSQEMINLCFLARWKTRGRGPGVRGPGVWKTRGLVENAGSDGKRGVRWKTGGLVENAGSGGKSGV